MIDRSHEAEAVESAAALWLIRREDQDWSVEDEAVLAAWLDQSMKHRAAFWRLEHGWQEADRIAALGPEFAVRRSRRLLRRWFASPRRVFNPALAAAVAAVIVFVAGGLWWRHIPNDPVTTAAYDTPVGGRRMVTLVDGSKVELNTATRMRAATRTDAREVWLDEGEAFFDIVHRPDRRFVVHAGPRTITVLGTRFSVRREGAKVTVAVISGRVRVDDADAVVDAARTAIVASGNVAVVEARSTLVTSAGQAHVAAITAWRDGMIVFDDTPLPRAAEEFNRYAARPIRIDDPGLARLRIGGTFRTGDREAFISLLHRAYGIEVREDATAVVLTR